jgi:hypothetical protein
MLWHAAGARGKGKSPPSRPSDTRLGIASRRSSTNPPCVAILGTVWELCGKACVNSLALYRPLPYCAHVAPLERGQRNPRKSYSRLSRARPGRRHDVGPVERVSSVTSSLVWPSLSLCHHPGHCSTIPGVVKARDDETPAARCCASYGLPSAAPSSQHTDRDRTGGSHATTLKATPKRVQDSPRRLPGARFARTTVNSVTLCAMPPYVVLKNVRHDCKPPPLGL